MLSTSSVGVTGRGKGKLHAHPKFSTVRKVSSCRKSFLEKYRQEGNYAICEFKVKVLCILNANFASEICGCLSKIVTFCLPYLLTHDDAEYICLHKEIDSKSTQSDTNLFCSVQPCRFLNLRAKIPFVSILFVRNFSDRLKSKVGISWPSTTTLLSLKLFLKLFQCCCCLC